MATRDDRTKSREAKHPNSSTPSVTTPSRHLDDPDDYLLAGAVVAAKEALAQLRAEGRLPAQQSRRPAPKP
jgi:hypothetical protein